MSQGRVVLELTDDSSRLSRRAAVYPPCRRPRGRHAGFFVVALDAQIVNVALPNIGSSLGGGLSGLQ